MNAPRSISKTAIKALTIYSSNFILVVWTLDPFIKHLASTAYSNKTILTTITMKNNTDAYHLCHDILFKKMKYDILEKRHTIIKQFQRMEFEKKSICYNKS